MGQQKVEFVTVKIHKTVHEDAVVICDKTNQRIGGYFTNAINVANKQEQERLAWLDFQQNKKQLAG